MADLAVFDACCYLGRTLPRTEGQPETPEALLAEMDHFGLREALVLDTACWRNPRAGNERVIERTRDHPRLHPAWSVLATHSRETPPPEELVARMREERVGALYLFHRHFSVSLEDWSVDDLLGALEEARVPLFVCPNTLLGGAWASDVTDWRAVVRICRAFPDLPLVVTENRIYGGQRMAYEALEACPNLRIDLSAIWLHKRVEFICREFGPHRLVMGTQLPLRSPAAPLTQLLYSDLAEEEIALIAGGNLRQLLLWNSRIEFAGEVSFAEPVDALHAAAREGRSLRGEEFHDCHGHLGWCSPRHVIQDTAADVVAEMDKFGVRSCCVFSFASGDETYGNDLVAEVVARYPDRFIGFTLVHPAAGEKTMLAELERGLELGMQGIKLAPSFEGYPEEGPLIDVACRFAHERSQFILNHYWGSAAQMRRLCETYPGACFFTGHSAAHYVEVVRDCDNLYICTCPFLAWGQTEQYVDLYGADRLLFGSDLMDLPIGWGLGPILYARIAEADKRKILGGNLLGLMERFGVRPRGW